MRCRACDHNLSDVEATRKGVSSGEFLDLCNRCYKSVEDQVPAYSKLEDTSYTDPDMGDWNDEQGS